MAKSWLHGDLFLPQWLHAVKRLYFVRIISTGFCWLYLSNISWACFLYVFSTALVLPLTHCLHARSCLQSAPVGQLPKAVTKYLRKTNKINGRKCPSGSWLQSVCWRSGGWRRLSVSFSGLLHLIQWVKVPQINPELCSVAHCASHLALGPPFSTFHHSTGGIVGRLLFPPSVYVGSGDPISSSHVYIANALAFKPSPQPLI